MKTFILLIALLLALTGMAGATYSAITAVSSLDELNDNAYAPAAWTTLADNGSINYIQWPAGYDLIIGVNVTAYLATNYIHVMAGDNPPAWRSGIGNLSVATWGATHQVRWIGPLESARFMNDTGYLELSSYNVTGKVMALKVKG